MSQPVQGVVYGGAVAGVAQLGDPRALCLGCALVEVERLHAGVGLVREAIDSDDVPFSSFHLPLEPVRALGNLALRVALFDCRHHAAQLIDPLEVVAGAGLQVPCQALHEVRAAEWIDDGGDAGGDMGGGDGGRNAEGRLNHGGVWRSENEWPLGRTVLTTHYLRSDGGLSTETPGVDDLPADYVHDPERPVPTIASSVTGLSQLVKVPEGVDPVQWPPRTDGPTITYTTIPPHLDPALADEDPVEEIGDEEKVTREVRLDGKKNDQMAFHALADYQNHVIGWLQRE